MSQPPTVQAWLQDGPVDGLVRSIDCGADGHPPPLLLNRGGDLLVGSSDEPAPVSVTIYELEPPAAAELWSYRHAATLSG